MVSNSSPNHLMPMTRHSAVSSTTVTQNPTPVDSRRPSSDTLHEKDEQIRHKYEHKLLVCEECRQHIGKDEEAWCAWIRRHDHAPKDEHIVTWDNGTHDPAHPKQISVRRKCVIVIASGLMTFSVSFASSIWATTMFVTADEFGVSSEVMLLGLSLYILGFAFGPLIFGPMSEVYGRTRPMLFGMLLFCIFQIPVAVAQNLETIFICRFLAGLFGSAPLAIVSGMFVDFLEPIERGIATSVYAATLFCGPAAGPIVGSYITASYLGWRWTAWITLILGATTSLLVWAVTPETFEPVLLCWKAQKLRHETGNWALHAKSEEQKVDLQSIGSKYLTKPLRMILKEPILVIVTLYMTLVYGLLYLTFEAYPISFEMDRGWSAPIASLPFIGILLGILIACLVLALHSKLYYGPRLIRTKKLNPEDRLPPMMLGSIILPVGLFWFAWTSHPSTPWPAQVVAGVFVGLGIILIFMAGVTYLVDVYLVNSASAIAVNTFIRSAAAAAFPLFATYMYDGLGVDWATSLLGFVSLALIPFPLLFWRYGKRVRSWSHFAFDLD